MKKVFVFTTLIAAFIAGGAEKVLRESILPGTKNAIPAAKYEMLEVPQTAYKQGTFTMWIRPDGWNNTDPAWHFFVTAGFPSGPGIWIYRFANGNIRLLWALKKGNAAEVVTKANFTSGKWTHIAVTWKEVKNGTVLCFYVDGKKIQNRWAGFHLSEKFPAKWKVGDVPNWTPRSKFSSTLGRVYVSDEVLSDAQIAALAAQKYDENGELTIINNNFIPCSTNVISGKAAANAAYLDVTFANENGKLSRKEIPGIFSRGYFRTELIIPDDCIETRLTVRDIQGKAVYWQPDKIEYADFLPPFMEDYWQASWIWYIKPFGGGTIRYARKKFIADPDNLELAAWQWAADDRSEVFINGVSLGKSRGWATPVVKDDLKKLLRKGENIIAARMENIGGSAGFFGELSLVDKNGNITKIGTDDTWKAHDKEVKNWTAPEFDDSTWGNAFVIMRPPQLPYGMTPYRNFARIPQLKMLSAPQEYSAALGSEVKISASFQAPERKVNEIFVTLIRNGRELYRQKADVSGENGKLNVSATIKIPANVSVEKYGIVLESRSCKFGENNNIGSLQLTPAHYKRQPTTAVVKKVAGMPTIFINEQPVPSMLYRNQINNRDDTLGNAYITAFDRAGILLTEINISLSQIWKADGSLNTDVVDLYLKSAIFYAPRSKFILFINVNAPAWYVKANPSENFITDKGFSNHTISYASDKYRKDTGDILIKLVKYLESCNEYDAIAGFGFDGGEDGQFMQWTGRNLNYIGDYSVPMMNKFHQELIARYGTIDKLNAAWQSNYHSFQEITIPAKERRNGANGKTYLDPVKDADVLVFNKVYGEAPADFMIHCAKTVKAVTGNKKLTSAYYGKFFSIAGVQSWAEWANEKVLASPYLDLLIAVEYSERGAGSPHSITAASESYNMHNKIYIDEADLRTFLSGSKSWGYAGNAFETVSMIRKMFIFNFVRGMGIHWYDLHGGMFENPAIINAMENTFKAAEKQMDVPVKKHAEIALIGDEPSMRAVTDRIVSLASASIRHQQNGKFSRIGAPYDMYFSNDLLREDFPEYKMYVFLNLWAPTPEVVKAIEKLKRDGKLLVFCGNAGLIMDNTIGAGNVAKLTGINMKQYPAKALTMKINLPGKDQTVWSSAGKTDFIIAANDPQAATYGEIDEQPEIKPFAIKKFNTHTVVHTAVPVLDVSVWQYLAEMAKIHFYTKDPDTMCYVGKGMLGVHCGTPGEKKIEFPAKADFIDAVTGEVYARNTRTLKINMKEKETKLIIVKER